MSNGIGDDGWTRLPRAGKSYAGLSRMSLYRLNKSGRIRFSVVTQPGRKTGITFFSAADLERLIRESIVSGCSSAPSSITEESP